MATDTFSEKVIVQMKNPVFIQSLLSSVSSSCRNSVLGKYECYTSGKIPVTLPLNLNIRKSGRDFNACNISKCNKGGSKLLTYFMQPCCSLTDCSFHTDHVSNSTLSTFTRSTYFLQVETEIRKQKFLIRF